MLRGRETEATSPRCPGVLLPPLPMLTEARGPPFILEPAMEKEGRVDDDDEDMTCVCR